MTLKKNLPLGVPIEFQLGTMRLWVRSLASLSGIRIQHCCELWCRLQRWLRCGIAVAMVWTSGYSSHWTPSMGTPYAAALDKTKKKKKKKKKKTLPKNSIIFKVQPAI